MRRDLFTAEQEDFRLLIREFTEREIVPRYAEWEQAASWTRSGCASRTRPSFRSPTCGCPWGTGRGRKARRWGTCLQALVAGSLSGSDAAVAKLFCTEMQARVVDRCLQLFGGYGYITEFPIARLYAHARVTRIYSGTSEVMKSIISKSLGL